MAFNTLAVGCIRLPLGARTVGGRSGLQLHAMIVAGPAQEAARDLRSERLSRGMACGRIPRR